MPEDRRAIDGGGRYDATSTAMRLLTMLGVVVGAGFAAIVLSTNVFRPAPAADRLAGVTVAVVGYTTEDIDDRRHRLRLTVEIGSGSDLDECLGFTLDQPFGAAGCRSTRSTAFVR
jgi:hypothetical protein